MKHLLTALILVAIPGGALAEPHKWDRNNPADWSLVAGPFPRGAGNRFNPNPQLFCSGYALDEIAILMAKKNGVPIAFTIEVAESTAYPNGLVFRGSEDYARFIKNRVITIYNDPAMTYRSGRDEVLKAMNNCLDIIRGGK